MGKTYRPYVPEQDLLLPPSLRDWLPENHLAYLVSEVIDQLDLSRIESHYEREERGYPPYHPRMMTKLLVYGYCVGVYSSRRLERRVVEDVAFRVLAAGNQPDFRTISDFRRIHLKALGGLFDQVLRLALEMGAMKLGRVAIDGSKVQGNASRHKAMSYRRMQEEEKRLKQEVRRLLAEAERVDAEEDARYGRDRRGDELPAELQRREDRLRRIREAKRALEQRAREEAKDDGRSEDEQKEAKPAPKSQYSFTDPESRIMKGPDGFLQGYNAQIAVEPLLQLIVGQAVTQQSNDMRQLLPMIHTVEEQSGQKPAAVLADSGYCSEENLREIARLGVEGYASALELLPVSRCYSDELLASAIAVRIAEGKLPSRAITALGYSDVCLPEIDRLSCSQFDTTWHEHADGGRLWKDCRVWRSVVGRERTPRT